METLAKLFLIHPYILGLLLLLAVGALIADKIPDRVLEHIERWLLRW